MQLFSLRNAFKIKRDKEMDWKNKKMDLFNQKMMQSFQEPLPEMPNLPADPDTIPEIQKLDWETLDHLQAAGEMMQTDILRFLNKNT